MNYALHLLTTVLIFAGASSGLAVLAGPGKQASLLAGAYLAIGAYLFVGITLWNWLLISSCIVAFAALSAVAVVAFWWLEDDLYVLVTLALQVMVTDAITNWTALTNGPLGIVVEARHSLGFPSAGIFFLLCLAGIWALARSRLLIEFNAAATVPKLALSLGHNVKLMKGLAVIVGALPAFVAGILFASYVGYIDPTEFDLSVSLFVLTIVIIGGSGIFVGPIAGSLIVVLVPEALRLIDISPSTASELRLILFNVILVGVLVLRCKNRQQV